MYLFTAKIHRCAIAISAIAMLGCIAPGHAANSTSTIISTDYEPIAGVSVQTDDNGTDDVSVVREHKYEVIVEEKKSTSASGQIYTTVEVAPSFPGGMQAMYEWLAKNMRYPEIAAQNNIQGRVILRFVVEKDGSIGEVKVARGRDPHLDAEAVRLVKAMPRFTPGKMNGEAVRTWFTLPVSFKMATR